MNGTPVILITMVEGRSNFSKEIGQLVRQAYGRNIYSFDPKSKVALAYEQFTKEVLQNEKQREKYSDRQL